MTIELLWKNNEKKVSCVPGGNYTITKRYSKRYDWHLQLMDAENRSLILMHPANNAMKELQGCIAPVTKFSGPGLGLISRFAFGNLKVLVYPVLERNEKIVLIIKS